MTQYKLMGSSCSLDDLYSLIKKKWGWDNFIFEPCFDKNKWNVRIKGKLDGEFRVIYKSKRYRFEYMVGSES